MPKKPDTPITLVVRRGALRRFDKLKKDTDHLPVVVTWDRRVSRPDDDGASVAPPGEERRKPLPFTWDLADFVVVAPPGAAASGESSVRASADAPVEITPAEPARAKVARTAAPSTGAEEPRADAPAPRRRTAP